MDGAQTHAPSIRVVLVVKEIELRLLAKRLNADYLTLRNLEPHRDEMGHILVHDLRNGLAANPSISPAIHRYSIIVVKHQATKKLLARPGLLLTLSPLSYHWLG